MTGTSEHPERVIITRPAAGSGLGSNLCSLAGALYFARQKGAALAVDWTGMDELKDKSVNMFTRFFDAPPAMAGVPVFYRGHASRPICEEVFSGAFDLRSNADSFRAIESALAESPGGAVRLTAYHGLDRVRKVAPELLTAGEEHENLRRVFREIKPAENLARKIDDWVQDNLGDRFVVGVNVRGGNGLFDAGSVYRRRVNTSVFRNRASFLRGLRRAVASRISALPPHVRADAKVFFASDNHTMYEWLRDLPGFVTRRTVFPPPGVGHAWSDYAASGHSDIDAMEDVIADMFILSHCHALVYNSSTFNLFARVATQYFSGNLVHIEKFYPLTTAVLNGMRVVDRIGSTLKRAVGR